MNATYTLSVTIVRAIDPDDTAADYLQPEVKRELERELMKVLRRLDGDCDVECMNAHITEE